MREKLTKKNEQTGFTIIEVVLVLAIAGLIFLIVFLALPQLQRSRRDSQRKSDAGRMVAAINNYQSNNGGDIPTRGQCTNRVIPDYMTTGGSSFADPQEGDYATCVTPNGIDGPRNAIGYGSGMICDGNRATTNDAGTRNYVVTVGLEEGTRYCQDNR